MKPATAWLVAIVGGGLAALLFGGFGLIVLALAVLYALMRTFS